MRLGTDSLTSLLETVTEIVEGAAVGDPDDDLRRLADVAAGLAGHLVDLTQFALAIEEER